MSRTIKCSVLLKDYDAIKNQTLAETSPDLEYEYVHFYIFEIIESYVVICSSRMYVFKKRNDKAHWVWVS